MGRYTLPQTLNRSEAMVRETAVDGKPSFLSANATDSVCLCGQGFSENILYKVKFFTANA